MENANDFIALEGAATRQCLAILHLPPVPIHHSLALEHEKTRTPSLSHHSLALEHEKARTPYPRHHSLALEHEKACTPSFSHHPLAFFLHANAGCICESGNVLQGIAL